MPANFSEYINLRPFDVSPTAVYLDAIDYARVALPEFQPRQGTPEDAILQAVSYISSLNISAINRLPDRLMAGIVGLMGVELDEGSKTVIDVQFTCTTNSGTTVPQGTVIRYEYEFLGEKYSIYFETSTDLVITGNNEGDPLPFDNVLAESFNTGTIVPLQNGTLFDIETPTTDILYAELASTETVGTNQETESEYLNRAVSFLGSLSTTFARANQVDSFIASSYQSTISRSKTYDLTNSNVSTGNLNIGSADQVGYATVFTYGIGALATESQKVDLLIDVQDRSIAGLQVDVVDVNLVSLAITATVSHSKDYESSVILSNIKSVLSSVFSPKNYRFSEGIKQSEFFNVLSTVAGVFYITNLAVTVKSASASLATASSNNITFVKKGSLPSIALADITITTQVVDS
jgi:uncharacterized phage protein gp47/JayE